MATDTRGTAATDDKGKPAKKRTTPILFYRQVVAELRKVIWPTRQELVNYTVVSLVFVAIMIAIVVALDTLFGKGVLWLFTK